MSIQVWWGIESRDAYISLANAAVFPLPGSLLEWGVKKIGEKAVFARAMHICTICNGFFPRYNPSCLKSSHDKLKMG